MNNIKLSRDIINIIRKYLTISKYNVKRNYTLIITHVNKISKNSRKRFSSDTLSPSFLNKKNKFCYCLFCDKITNYDIGFKYAWDDLFRNIGRNTKYIFNNNYNCCYCFNICIRKFNVLGQLKQIKKLIYK
jgi:hypothetical protein